MAIRKFVAPTTREAMLQVRRELGDEAVIIANRRAGNRIEILAAAPDAVEALVERSESRPQPASRPRTPLNERIAAETPARDTARAPKVEAFQDFVRRQMAPPEAAAAARRTPARTAAQRTAAPLAQRNGAGVAMYQDVAEIDDAEAESFAPAPVRDTAAPRRTVDIALHPTALDDAGEMPPRRTAQPATTVHATHRAQQVEVTDASADPAVFRRRPARVAPAVRPAAAQPIPEAPTAPRAQPMPAMAARLADLNRNPAAVQHPMPAQRAMSTHPAMPAQQAVPAQQPMHAQQTMGAQHAMPAQATPPIAHAPMQPPVVATPAIAAPAMAAAAVAPVAAPATAARDVPAAAHALAAGSAQVPALPAREAVAVAAAQFAQTHIGAPVAAGAVRPAHAAPIVLPAAQAIASVPASDWTLDTSVAIPHAPAAPVAANVPALNAAAAAPHIETPARPSAMESHLLAELQSMRTLLQEQFASLASRPAERPAPVQQPAAQPATQPAPAAQQGQSAMRVMTRLLTAGFSAEVARRVASHAPQSIDAAQAETWLHEVLARNIRCPAADDGIVERAARPATPGQVFALVGPTGVGKTTTVAKLAARFAVRHGTSALGLITLDAYRVAAPEQLRAYGRILGTPVHLAQDSATLRELLATMVHKRLVLIDTCGVSQRDERLAEMLDLLCIASAPGRPVQRVLLLNSASHAETLEEAARAWRAPECAGAILTKLDEATRIGGALDVSLRHRLIVLGLTNGQRVPEDWHGANSRLLAHLALKPASQLFELDETQGAALAHAQAVPVVSAQHGVPHA
jgi:flagellar biosynthesis protein FlhF